MLDPTTATFETAEDPETDTVVLVGNLMATQAVTLRRSALRQHPDPDRALAEAQATLLLTLWAQAYGRLGGIIDHLHAQAEEAGDLRYLSPLREARALLRPALAVPTPTPTTDTTAS